MSTSSYLLRSTLVRPSNPAILPIPSRSTGNNVPKSLHKTRRTWRPNTSRVDWTVGSAAHAAFGGEAPVLGSSSNAAAASAMDAIAGHVAGRSAGRGASVVKGVKMQMRRRKDVEKAGGLEGLLVSLRSVCVGYVPGGASMWSGGKGHLKMKR
jgi:hypothetical protein